MGRGGIREDLNGGLCAGRRSASQAGAGSGGHGTFHDDMRDFQSGTPLAQLLRFLLPLLLMLAPGSGLPAQETGASPAPPAGEEAAAVEPSGTETAAEAGAKPAGTETAAGAERPVEAAEPSPEQKRMEMDIKTSSLSELAVWCRELGLSEGGGKEELANRLRSHFKLPSPAGSGGEENPKTIIIESARTSEYFTVDSVNEEYARLTGDVVISLDDGGKNHRVSAREILYNRTRNVITASGGVRYVMTEGDTTETFKGETITVNLDNWSSIFLDGVSERALSGADTAYLFSGTVISRTDEDVTLLADASITNAKGEDSFWSLNASRLWLLPGSDWAVLNAVLKVGNIPVFYLPALPYPTDEIIFHPVLGTRSRAGTFIQTTTYFLGRSKPDETKANSFSKILGSGADMEKKREGLFLRSTGKKDTSANDKRFSIIADGYTNLGAYLGTELTLPAKGKFGATNLSAGVGFTRNVYQTTPFTEENNYESEWNSSNLFSLDVPFRYRLNYSSSFSAKYGSLTWAFPYYSDTHVDSDFVLQRSEEIDLMGLVKKGSAVAEEEATSTSLSSYEWKLSGALTPVITKLAPWVNTLSVSNISTTVAFKSKTLSTSDPDYNSYDPSNNFFYPDKYTLFSLNASAAGTPFKRGTTQTAAAGTGAAAASGETLLPALPRSPWPKAEEKAAGTADPLAPPALAQRFTFSGSGWRPGVNLNYSLTPAAASEMQFDYANSAPKHDDDIDWGDYSSILSTISGNGSLGLSVSPGNSAYSVDFSLSGNGTWKDYTYINEDAEVFTTGSTTVETLKNTAKQGTAFSSEWKSSVTAKPLFWNAVWSGTSLSYTLSGILAKSVYDLTEEDWKWEFSEWDKEKLTTHQAAANFAASVFDKSQTLSLTADLPPKYASYAGSATMRAWISTTSFNTKYYENSAYDPESDDEKNTKWRWGSLSFTETLSFGTLGSFVQNIEYDPNPDVDDFTRATSTLSLGGIGLSASFSAVRAQSYELKENTGWELQTTSEQKLRPTAFTLGYSKTFTKDKLWKDRLAFSVGINSNLSFDLQRYTYSSLTFGLTLTTKIAKFLDLSFTSSSANSTIYRYVQDWPIWDVDLELPGEKNVFLDLLNSFRFDDDDKRRSSGFKLKSLKLDLTHHLGDWDATLGMNLKPYLDGTTYKFDNEISFSVKWVPLSEVKTDITRKRNTSTNESVITIE
ncbi:MAG: LPS-assembly protein LptD [Treponematales bacterium]